MLKAPGHSSALLFEGADRSWGQPHEIAHTCAHETDPGRAGDRGQVHTRILGLARGQHRKQSTRTIKLQSNFLITISTTQNFFFFTKVVYQEAKFSAHGTPGAGLPRCWQSPSMSHRTFWGLGGGPWVRRQTMPPHHKRGAEMRLVKRSGLGTCFSCRGSGTILRISFSQSQTRQFVTCLI